MTKPLIIVGNTAFAEIAYEYFTHDSPYRVVGFSVEREWLKETQLCGLPVAPFEDLEEHFAPQEHAIFVAATYTQQNRLRARLLDEAEARGYTPASYISSKAFVWRNVELGEHCFIFENNVIQPFCKLGRNNILWSGNHIGHHSTIGDHCFIASHIVISGFVTVGDYVFMGVNASLANNLTLGSDCWIGPGVTVTRDVEPGTMLKPVSMRDVRTGIPPFFREE
ncbi:MAG: acetyltransferase [Acidobacteriota bacterium]|nr:acetyltransferase [Acidobacteriota bacterium]